MPNPAHLRESDIQDVAKELIEGIKLLRAPIALFLLPDGKVKAVARFSLEFARYCRWHEFSLVGVYNAISTEQDVIEDLKAAERT